MCVYVCMYVCICVCVCVCPRGMVFYFPVSGTVEAIKLVLPLFNIVIPSSSFGTAEIWKLLKVHFSIIYFRVTPLSLGPHPTRTSTQTQVFMYTHHTSPSKADSSSERSIIKTLSPDLFWSS
jgi:hypothetical protein